MKRMIYFLFIQTMILSCSTPDLTIYTENAPDWVNNLRTGDNTFKIKNGDKYLYRSINKDKDVNQSTLCQAAIDKNIENIKNSYPFIKQIPMTVELVYYDPIVKDCATTVSVMTSLVDKADGIQAMKKDYDEALEKLESDGLHYKEQIETLNNEKTVYEIKIKELQNFINRNSYLLEKATRLEERVNQMRAKLSDRNYRVSNHIINGMTKRNVEEILGYSFSTTYDYGLCVKHFDTSDTSFHGSYLICWNGAYDSRIVVGYCSALESKCWYRSPN